MKKNKIILIGIGVICILYGVVFYFLVGSKTTTTGHIIVSNLGGFYCKAKDCVFKSIEDIDVNNKKINVYSQNEKIGNYNFLYSNRWDFYENGEWVPFYGEFVGIEESLNANVKAYQYEELSNSDQEVVLTLLKEKGITTDFSHYKGEALVLDFDENDIKDRIITVSNQTEEERNGPYYSLLFLELNGKTIEIFNETTTSIYHIPFFKVSSIFTLDEEKNPRLIVEKYYFNNVGEDSISMYQLNGKKIKEICSKE